MSALATGHHRSILRDINSHMDMRSRSENMEEQPAFAFPVILKGSGGG